ncbi:MAG: O-antigen ligase family protein [Candidatus Poribacteria bacterium]|nr:O-antigen ligase family protein [Candidatus Poribacteria bacterium]
MFLKHAKRILLFFICLVFGGIIGGYSDTPLPLLSLLVVTGAFVFLGMEIAVYLLLIALPFSFRYILPGRFEIQTPTEPLLGMLVAVYCAQKIVDRVLQKEKPENTFPFLVPLCAYIFVTFLSGINTPDLFGTFKGALRATVYMLFSVIVYAVIQNRATLKRLFIATFPSAAVAVIWTVIVLIYHIDAWQWTSAYRSAPFTNYSVYGAFTAIFFLVCLSRLLFDNSTYDRVLWTAWFVCFSVGLLMCFSRGVWLSVIVTVGFMLLQLGRGVTHKKILFMGAACLILLVCLNLPGVYHIIIERVSSAVDISYASNRARLLRWGQAVVMFLENPILGKGYGAFAMLYEEDVALVGSYTAQYQLGAHSEYLQVMAELGIVGLGVWIWLNLAFLRYGFRALKTIDDGFYRSVVIGLMAAEISLMVHFTVNNLLNGDAIGIPFWGIYGLLPAVVQMAAREKTSSEIKDGV